MKRICSLLGIVALLAAGFALTTSCGDDEDMIVEHEVIRLSKKTMDFSSKAASQSIAVHSAGVTAETDAEWCHVETKSYAEFKNATTVIVTVDANDEMADREAVVTLRCGVARTDLKVYQEASSGINIRQDKYSVNAEGGMVVVDMEANGVPTVTIGASWVTEIKTRGDMQSLRYMFNVDQNDGFEREATITFSLNGVNEKVIIYQNSAE